MSIRIRIDGGNDWRGSVVVTSIFVSWVGKAMIGAEVSHPDGFTIIIPPSIRVAGMNGMRWLDDEPNTLGVNMLEVYT